MQIGNIRLRFQYREGTQKTASQKKFESIFSGKYHELPISEGLLRLLRLLGIDKNTFVQKRCTKVFFECQNVFLKKETYLTVITNIFWLAIPCVFFTVKV